MLVFEYERVGIQFFVDNCHAMEKAVKFVLRAKRCIRVRPRLHPCMQVMSIVFDSYVQHTVDII